MSVLKYLDPVTGEYTAARSVKVVEVGGGGDTAPDAAPEQLTASGYPSYVAQEVIEVAEKVQAVRKSDSIVFIAMSDSHYCADQTTIGNWSETNASAVQANQAAKVLSYLVKPDFLAHLGDVSCGHSTTTPDMLRRQIEGFVSYFREAKSDLPVFIAVGNHDSGIYYHDAQTDGANHTMTGEYLYNTFTALSASDDTVFGDASFGGYCYRDFADKKLRVFLLNTSEGIAFRQTDSCTLGAQRLWLANALLDLNRKSDAVEWGFVVLCHYPADYGGTMPLSELFRAYVTGGSITIAGITGEDFASTAVNFSGKNGAKFLAQFHGHVHNFKSSKLYSYATGRGVQYDAWRMCIPNGQYNRENYYTTVGNYTDISFAEDVSYPKTANTANGTSFVVNVINPGEEKIYSFCYGAGYDRVIGIGATVYHSVSLRLTNVTSGNDALSVEDGTMYTTTLTPEDGYNLDTVTVTMDGTDITSTAYSDGVVTIAAVTGNVVITAKATAKPNFTNLVPLSVNTDGTDFYVDGDGYDQGMYIASNGDAAALGAGSVITGFIPVKKGAKTIRIAGDGVKIDGTYTRIAFYDASFNMVAVISNQNMGIQHSDGSYYNGKLIEEDATAITLQILTHTNGVNGVYMRVCTGAQGENLIVTVDEEITYGGAA